MSDGPVDGVIAATGESRLGGRCTRPLGDSVGENPVRAVDEFLQLNTHRRWTHFTGASGATMTEVVQPATCQRRASITSALRPGRRGAMPDGMGRASNADDLAESRCLEPPHLNCY